MFGFRNKGKHEASASAPHLLPLAGGPYFVPEEAKLLLDEAGYTGPGVTDVPTLTDSDSVGAEDRDLAHYASKMQIEHSQRHGTPVQALCGKLWTPAVDPTGIPVCPRCRQIFELLPSGA